MRWMLALFLVGCSYEINNTPGITLPVPNITQRHQGGIVPGIPGSDVLIMAQAGEYLGQGIAGAVNLINPQIVVIGGGVSEAGEVLLKPVREAVRRYAVPESARGLRIVAGELKARGGLLGAAALALQECPPLNT